MTTKDDRIKALEGHRTTWRRRAWRLEDALRLARGHIPDHATATLESIDAALDTALDDAEDRRAREAYYDEPATPLPSEWTKT